MGLTNGATNNKGLSFWGYTKKALDIALHPSSVNQSYGVGDAIAFYYKAAIIPAIAAAVLGFVLLFAFGSIALGIFGAFSPFLSGIAAYAPALMGIFGAVLGLAYVLLLIPIGIIVDGAIYHFFAKTLFKLWKNDISKTITATMYATFPAMLLMWAFFIPILGEVVAIVASIWSFIVLIISMARQQQVSGWRAFGGILISGIVLSIIIVAIEFIFLLPVLSSTSPAISSYCIPNTGFVCSNTSFSNGVISAGVAQSTGISMIKSRLFFVPFGQNLSTVDPSYYIGNFSTNSLVKVKIGGVKEVNNSVLGNLTLEYYTSISQSTPYIKVLGTFGYYG
ncbi:Yip1 domain protein [Candidatus Micrarchaeum sp.]|jgi:hypothetical protein|uniref:YIP1 family protein n=1 Tax=Candidatus Micrarchaeum sp. TaxID=2282148 RepID=UPI00092AB9BF|nr:YIP1 family protein [Candidatus Micrarchaeum sp.]OJT94392.1 MAG: hypothetical protein JJ59_02895 [Candidatus Micrarchaeum sp. AZ1]OWP53600.1 MAG: hypothetical protein B2I19_04165 [Thermoplasmatales archaeon ARMAN]QRF73616.1 Yip1 domain protein [Candidatus Micrarchaeum sp.]